MSHDPNHPKHSSDPSDPHISLTKQKDAMRALARGRRAQAHGDHAYGSQALLSHRANDIVAQCGLDRSGLKLGAGLEPGAVIAGYHPIKDELDCLALLSSLRELGFLIALPKMRKDENSLDFYEWNSEDLLAPGAFGVMEPRAISSPVVPSVVLLPLLAFDLDGGRLGYGGGYYDRAIAALRLSLYQADQPVVIGIGFDEQEVAAVPRDSNDQLLDFIATPTRLLKLPHH